MNDEYLQILETNTPNHVLHAVISIVTLGVWLPIWAIQSAVCCSRRNRYHSVFGGQRETNYAALVLIGMGTLGVSFVVSIYLTMLGFKPHQIPERD